MEEKDFNRIEQMMFAVVDAKFSQFKREIVEEFDHRLGLHEDNFQHKLDLVVEGQQMLAERMDRMEERLDNRIDQVEKRLDLVEVNISKKIDGVAAGLTAHRADTEAHHGVYRVKENGN